MEDADRSGDANRSFRRRPRSSSEDEDADGGQGRHKRFVSREGQNSAHGKDRDHRDRRGHGSCDRQDRHRDPVPDSRSRHADIERRDLAGSEEVRGTLLSVAVPGQSSEKPVSVSDQSPKKHIPVADHSSKKSLPVSDQTIKKFANQPDGKLVPVVDKALSVPQESVKHHPSVVGMSNESPTACLVLENVFEKIAVVAFDYSVKKEESALSLEVEEFVHEKCARHGGPVIHMHVDRSRGLVYVRFANKRYSQAAKENLDGTLYKTSRLISAIYLDDFKYMQMFGR